MTLTVDRFVDTDIAKSTVTNYCLVVYNTYMPLNIVAEQSDPPTTECSAVGSALDLGSRGRGFEPHHSD